MRHYQIVNQLLNQVQAQNKQIEKLKEDNGKLKEQTKQQTQVSFMMRILFCMQGCNLFLVFCVKDNR